MCSQTINAEILEIIDDCRYTKLSEKGSYAFQITTRAKVIVAPTFIALYDNEGTLKILGTDISKGELRHAVIKWYRKNING